MKYAECELLLGVEVRRDLFFPYQGFGHKIAIADMVIRCFLELALLTTKTKIHTARSHLVTPNTTTDNKKHCKKVLLRKMRYYQRRKSGRQHVSVRSSFSLFLPYLLSILLPTPSVVLSLYLSLFCMVLHAHI
jgi:hypothetical protein